MKKRMISIIAALTVAATPINAVAEGTNTTIISEENSPSEITLAASITERVDTKDQKELLNLIEASKNRKVQANSMAESARELGYDEDHPVILLAKEEWANAQSDNKYYAQTYDEVVEQERAKWAKANSEYPVATRVWRYLSEELGYNDYVCAGILGNMMAEVGGHTLNLQYSLSGTYYGLCQWSHGYGEVWGAGVEGQLSFLGRTIQSEIDTYGYKYQSGFKYSNFKNLTDEKAAAKAFAKAYERCAGFSILKRQSNATKAYNYFAK